MKRMIALMLAVLMLVGLFTGCGKQEAPAPEQESSSNQEASKPAEKPAEPEKEEEEIVTLKLVTRVGSFQDQDMVQEEINKILREKIGVEIELGFIGLGEYDQNVKTMMAGGDDIDIVFTSNFANDYYSHDICKSL